MPVVELAEHSRQLGRRPALHEADVHAAAHQALDRRHRVTPSFGRGQHRPRLREQGLSRVAELDVSRAPFEEAGAELLLQGADRGRQPGLHDVNAARGARELPLFGDRDEVL
ncbi:MAG TPA: hypothetical protein VF752_02425 [Thermoleophilaceae bacterium]